ncbi:MAG: metallopeptidase TldD-related protein [bacterium]|nr:metallopeptidase TldD-related protein [bacterium]
MKIILKGGIVEMTVQQQPIDAKEYFASAFGVPMLEIQATVHGLLESRQDGELFLERIDSDGVGWKDGRAQPASKSVEQGYGLRGVSGYSIAYATGNKLSLAELKRAGKVLTALPKNSAEISESIMSAKLEPLYDPSAFTEMPLNERRDVLRAIDDFARQSPGVTNVSTSLLRERKMIVIVRHDGTVVVDVRPLVRLNISVQREKDGKREWGSSSIGGRALVAQYLESSLWRFETLRAERQAVTKLEARPCPAGKMPVVLGPGWSGVILHEAIGHPLEGDAVRKGESVFRDSLGNMIASPLVTVVDDGTVPFRRGSLRYDDEGTPTERTVLIENGKLVSFMHDRLSARHFGVRSTGSGRRESYRHVPLVRMRNTFMLSGVDDPEAIIGSTKEGLYVPDMGGGQVDPVSGKFVFAAAVAYMIENYKKTYPVKGATLIGKAEDVLKYVDRVGNDSALDNGTGTCGKDGQGVPVGVGQPTIRITTEGLTVGGTDI